MSLAHNYPSGIAEPCQADITSKLCIVLMSVDVQILDHLATRWRFYLHSVLCCKKDRRRFLITLTDYITLGPEVVPRE